MPRPDHNKHAKVWAEPAFFEHVFNIGRVGIESRGVTKQGGKFDVEDFYKKCSDLILSRLLEQLDDGSDETLGQLKMQKTREEVRKLAIANDREERNLVSREEVLPVYIRGMRRVTEILDAIPLRIKMRSPDVPPAILSVVTEEIAKARNEAAKEDLNL